MKKTVYITVFLIFILLFTSCSGNKPVNSETETVNVTETEAVSAETEAPGTEPVTEDTTHEDTDAETTGSEETDAPETADTETETEAGTETEETEVWETFEADTDFDGVFVYSVTIESPASKVQVGKTIRLTAAVFPEYADNKKIKWSVISGSKYAKVDQNGNVTGKSVGVCKIAAIATDGSNARDSITLKVVAQSLFEGSGTQSDPYIISDANDLNNIRKLADRSGVYFKQTADIDLSNYSPWDPVGMGSKPFKNNYNGGGFRITGLNITAGEAFSSLFGAIENAKIENTIINNAIIKGGADSGLLFGRAVSSVISGCKAIGTVSGAERAGGLGGSVTACDIKNCSAAATVSGSSEVGGLVGRCDGVENSIVHCSSAGSVYAEFEKCGGLIGCADAVNISKSYSTSSVSCRGGLMGGYAGGLVGSIDGGKDGGAVISECYASGDVSVTGTEYGCAFAGGLIGWMLSYTEVHDCYATGGVSICGTYSGARDYLTYDGGIWYKYRNPAGALIGGVYVSDTISVYNCYATGSVTSETERCCDKFVYCAGSLVGMFFDDQTRKLIKPEYKGTGRAAIEEKYIDITADMLDGSVIKKLSGNYCVSTDRDYYTPMNYIVNGNETNTMYKSMPQYKVVTNIEAGQLKSAKTFAGWNFASIWRMTANGPALRSVG